jgi:hypothetical protein
LLFIVEKPERLSGTTLKRKHGEHALREVPLRLANARLIRPIFPKAHAFSGRFFLLP